MIKNTEDGCEVVCEFEKNFQINNISKATTHIRPIDIT